MANMITAIAGITTARPEFSRGRTLSEDIHCPKREKANTSECGKEPP
jgi:hypothetical protein